MATRTYLSSAFLLVVCLMCWGVNVVEADEFWGCTNIDLLCKIVQQGVVSKAVESACNFEAAGGVPIKGSTVSIDGACYKKALTEDNMPYLVAGIAKNVGRCVGPSIPPCTVENCDGTTTSSKCAEQIPACTIYSTVCSKWSEKVQKGDTCFQLAKKYGIALSVLEKLNKGKCGPNLQVGETLCLAVKKEAGVTMCVGDKW